MHSLWQMEEGCCMYLGSAIVLQGGQKKKKKKNKSQFPCFISLITQGCKAFRQLPYFRLLLFDFRLFHSGFVIQKFREFKILNRLTGIFRLTVQSSLSYIVDYRLSVFGIVCWMIIKQRLIEKHPFVAVNSDHLHACICSAWKKHTKWYHWLACLRCALCGCWVPIQTLIITLHCSDSMQSAPLKNSLYWCQQFKIFHFNLLVNDIGLHDNGDEYHSSRLQDHTDQVE